MTEGLIQPPLPVGESEMACGMTCRAQGQDAVENLQCVGLGFPVVPDFVRLMGPHTPTRSDGMLSDKRPCGYPIAPFLRQEGA